MKKNYLKFLVIAAATFLLIMSGCNKERAVESDATFTVENIDSLLAGTPVNFVFEGEGDFATLYSGVDGKVWGEPGALGANVTGGSIAISYSKAGEYVVSMVVTSFGNWSEEEIVDVQQQTITVTDNRNDFAKFEIPKPRQVGEIVGNDITFLYADNVDLTALKPNFVLFSQDAVVSIGGVVQVSKETPVDFTNPVIYTVVAGDGSTRTYTVTMNTYPADTDADLIEFGTEDPVRLGVIDAANHKVNLYMPNGTDLTSVSVYAIPSSDEASMEIGTKSLKTSTNARDISAQPTIITVTAESEDIQEWELYTDYELAFDIFKFSNLVPEISGTVDILEKTVSVNVIEGTDLTTLVADFTLLGTGTVELSGTAQVSGVTANDFSTPLTYDLIMGDGTVMEYTVTVNTISK